MENSYVYKIWCVHYSLYLTNPNRVEAFNNFTGLHLDNSANFCPYCGTPRPIENKGGIVLKWKIKPIL